MQLSQNIVFNDSLKLPRELHKLFTILNKNINKIKNKQIYNDDSTKDKYLEKNPTKIDFFQQTILFYPPETSKRISV